MQPIVTESNQMELQRVFDIARVKQQQNQYITTTDLMDKALYMQTPWGKLIIGSVEYSHTRRVTANNQIHTIKFYRIKLIDKDKVRSILTTENNLFKLVD